MTVIVAYLPVLHQGYVELFKRHSEATTLFLLDNSLTHQLRSIVKDLRALPTEVTQSLIVSQKWFKSVEIITKTNAATVLAEYEQIIMPDEDINHILAGQLALQDRVTFSTIFLRWDARRSLSRQDPEPDVEISQAQLDQELMGQAKQLAERSSDWWRQVGAVLVKDGQVLLSGRNRHLPQDQQHYVDGDPRANFSSGEYTDITSSIHAEASLVAEAARQGISLAGSWLYATTFPCPVCAKLITEAGVERVYFSDGYSLADGETIMKSKGIRLIRVQ